MPQDPSVGISRNLHQAVPSHRRLINGSSTSQFWYGGRSVPLWAKTLRNLWATKRISLYCLARARITACRWIRGKSSTLAKAFYANIEPPWLADPEQSGFFCENGWASSAQNPLMRISQNLHPALPQHWALTNGSSIFDICYRGRSVRSGNRSAITRINCRPGNNASRPGTTNPVGSIFAYKGFPLAGALLREIGML